MINNRLLAVMISFVLVAGLGGQAFAQSTPEVQITLDFSTGVYSEQTLCLGSVAGVYAGCVYTEDGFSLATPDADAQHFDSDLGDGVLLFHNGGDNTVDQVVLSQFGGLQFNLESFDLVGAGTFLCEDPPAITLQANVGAPIVIPAGTTGTVQVDLNNVNSITFLPDTAAGLVAVCIDNLVFNDEPVVGGEFLSIDTTALMLAGLQSSAVWMLPTLAGLAGAGFYLIKFRANKE